MNAEKIGKAILYLRKRAGYTQQELAERLNVSDKAISRWERGVGVPDVSLLRKLSIILDMDIDSILEGSVAFHEDSWKGLLVIDRDPTAMVYDKPVFSYLISYFMLAKIRDITVLCEEEYREKLEKSYGFGEQLGIGLSYCTIRQDACLSDSIRGIKDRLEGNRVLIIYESRIIFGVNLTRFLQKALTNAGKTTILAIPTESTAETVLIDSEKRVVSCGNDKVFTEYRYHALPFLFCQKGIDQILSYSFSDFPECIRKLSEDKLLYAELMDRGYLDIKTNDTDSLLDAATFVRIYQQRSGLVLYSPDEIARRRGFL